MVCTGQRCNFSGCHGHGPPGLDPERYQGAWCNSSRWTGDPLSCLPLTPEYVFYPPESIVSINDWILLLPGSLSGGLEVYPFSSDADPLDQGFPPRCIAKDYKPGHPQHGGPPHQREDENAMRPHARVSTAATPPPIHNNPPGPCSVPEYSLPCFPRLIMDPFW